MGKVVFIAEKPSVAQDFAKALHLNFTRREGCLEAQNTIVTWCYGHLVTMSYPDAYDPKYKRWSLDTIPFIPDTYLYQVIDNDGTRKQFQIVQGILTNPEVDTIYICTDSGREGEYIYRLVANMAGVKDKRQLRVWIDSFTEEEIRRGIREARDDAEYDNMGAAAYLRAKEDYLMGINFSRALSLKYARGIAGFLGMDRCVIAVGRVMTCVLGIVVRREREIRAFVKTPFYRVVGSFAQDADAATFEAEWSAVEGSVYYESSLLYKENGFKEHRDADALIAYLGGGTLPEGTRIPGTDLAPGEVIAPGTATVQSIAHKKETRNAPLLYNLAELQNDCSRMFKISPDQTLDAAQALYEKKLTTYPRTDARVLSTAAAKEIDKNLKGLGTVPMYRELVRPIAESGAWKKIGKSRYTNDAAITDHYAIIPTGQGFQALQSLSPTYQKVYELIVRRFLAIFYPAAVFDKMTVKVGIKTEVLQASVRVNKERGYLDVMDYSWSRKAGGRPEPDESGDNQTDGDANGDPSKDTAALEARLKTLRKGDTLQIAGLGVKEGETTPPKRYNSGSMILTMENAGQFIENDELREQIKGAGIGTSATRAGILEKLVNIQYLNLNNKTQIYTPTQLGEMIYDTVDCSIRPMLDPQLTASWEKGLSQVAEGTTTEAEYTAKLNDYIVRRTNLVKESNNENALRQMYRRDAQYYSKPMHFKSKYTHSKTRKGSDSGSRRKAKGASENDAE